MQPNIHNQDKGGTGVSRGAKVLIFPADTLDISEKQVFFLFSMFQVEDILRDVNVQSVPFSPIFIEGIALWRNHVIPVLSLEKCLGLPSDTSAQSIRYVLIRSVGEEGAQKRSLIRTLSGVRMMTLPIKCHPVPFYHLVSEPVLVRGVYEWENGLLLVVNMENILKGNLY
jgi:chemotaxis signal transduction protein